MPTSKGAVLAKELRINNSIHILLGADGGFEEMLFHILQRPVARGDRYAVVPFLRRWALLYHCRIIEVGTQSGNEQLLRSPIYRRNRSIIWKRIYATASN